MELINKAEAFLKDTFAASTYLQSHPTDRDYRLEHSYRVANIAKNIAEAEGFNVTYAVLAGLLHDISYCEEMVTREDRMNHGRRSAAIARPFLESLGLPADTKKSAAGVFLATLESMSWELASKRSPPPSF